FINNFQKNPRLFVDGASRFDVQQGELGDCWLLAAISTITLFEKVFNNIVPRDQEFNNKYAGIFHFRFWQYGRWVDIVIDDKLPTYKDKLVFLHSSERDEFWSALLEKAYAKLHGSYEALKGGSTCEAMEDCTGGVGEMYELQQAPPNLFQIMVKAFQRTSLMGCSIEPEGYAVETQTKEGLIMGHAYGITHVSTVETNSGSVQLIRMRNPWGDQYEWKGAWSDRASQWFIVPDREKKRIGLKFDNDGEFWMSFKDFMKRFSRLEICNLGPDSLSADDVHRSKISWQTSFFDGEWVPGVTADWIQNNSFSIFKSFWLNPQYRITLKDPDEEDEEDKCSIIVALMQKNRRIQRTKGMDSLTIGFAIYKIKKPLEAPKPLDLNFFKHTVSVARSPTFVTHGEFLVRVCSENKANLDLTEDEGKMTFETGVVKNCENLTEKTEQVKSFFRKVAGEDMEVDWKELKDILDYSSAKDTNPTKFSKDVCRSMIAMMDSDHSGKLGLDEFRILWSNVCEWK
ncbi:hypothetical protein L9F63_010504, partial [Diploptera punctata]